MRRIGILEKIRSGAKRRPIGQHLTFRIVKRIHHSPPYEDAWHEYLAFEGEQLVGRVSSFEAPLGSRDCWINDLWVEQKHRHQGLGKALLRLTVENARARGYERVLGELTPYDNSPMEAVERFYRAQGFEVVDNWEGTGLKVGLLFL